MRSDRESNSQQATYAGFLSPSFLVQGPVRLRAGEHHSLGENESKLTSIHLPRLRSPPPALADPHGPDVARRRKRVELEHVGVEGGE